jgi:hypothetical protein
VSTQALPEKKNSNGKQKVFSKDGSSLYGRKMNLWRVEIPQVVKRLPRKHKALGSIP